MPSTQHLRLLVETPINDRAVSYTLSTFTCSLFFPKPFRVFRCQALNMSYESYLGTVIQRAIKTLHWSINETACAACSCDVGSETCVVQEHETFFAKWHLEFWRNTKTDNILTPSCATQISCQCKSKRHIIRSRPFGAFDAQAHNTTSQHFTLILHFAQKYQPKYIQAAS